MTLPSATALYINPSDFIPKGDGNALRKRLMSAQGKPAKREDAQITTRVSTAMLSRPARVWTVQQDSHVAAFYEWKGNEPLGFLKMRCRELGFDYDRIVGMTRLSREVEARTDLIAEVKQRFPEMSSPAIGKLFGGRDHTTILHFLHKRGFRAPQRPRSVPGYVSIVKKMFDDGALYKDIARAIKRSASTVSNVVKEQGWTREQKSLEDNAGTIKAMFDAGKSARDIGPAIGYSHVHVGAFIRKQGWTR